MSVFLHVTCHPCTLENPIRANVQNQNFFAAGNSKWVVFQIGIGGAPGHSLDGISIRMWDDEAQCFEPRPADQPALTSEQKPVYDAVMQFLSPDIDT